MRKLSRVEIEEDGIFLILSFEGESFLWQMVRRLVTALKKVGKNGLSLVELKSYLDADSSKKYLHQHRRTSFYGK